MRFFTKASLIATLALNSIYAQDATSTKEMFSNGQASGEFRFGYYMIDPNGSKARSATAVGGQIKIETASLNGFKFGSAIYTSHAILALSGKQEDGEFANFLTSSKKRYTEIAEAYFDYTLDDFDIRIGRQLIDTPLADSDDIAMTPNTFEAVMATYVVKNLGITILGANIQRMQGTDTNYENVTAGSWMDVGNKSTNMLATIYKNDNVKASFWYYDIGKLTKAIYTDVTASFKLLNDIQMVIGAQYLKENEEENSLIYKGISLVL